VRESRSDQNPASSSDSEPKFNTLSEPPIGEFDSDSINRNGKIARLPRSLRERVNQAIYRRFTANHLARELNKMPEVKAMLAAHFDGRPIVQQNISEWKRGGYRDWLHRQQILEQQSELTADAKDMAETADGMADSLFGLLTLDYARLMMNRDSDDETFEKKRKALSMLAQDVVRLRRSHLHARRVQIQETRLDNDTEKTEEQLFLKFTEWTENPAVRKACILAPMERDRRLRVIYEMPPAPEDPLVQRETQNDPYFGHFDEKQSKNKPIQTENSPPESNPPPPTSENKSDAEGQSDTVGPRCDAAAADTQVSPTTTSPVPPPNPYAGRCTQDIIAEIEANYAQQKAARLSSLSQRERDGVRENRPDENQSTPSDDHQSICRPKPNPLDAFSEPVHYNPMMTSPTFYKPRTSLG
jgi:hypothetical protein